MPPTFLIDSLNALRRRIKTLTVAFGLGLVLALAVAFVVGSVLVDFGFKYLLNIDLPGGMRLVFLLAMLVTVAVVFVRRVVKPLASRLSLGDVAGHLETVFPEFDDRLRSTVDFVQGGVPGSDYMKEQTVTQATEMARRRDLSQAVVSKPVWWSLGSGVAAACMLLGLAQYSTGFNLGLGRLFQPFADDLRWPKRVMIDAQKLPDRVPMGAPIEVSMRLKQGDNTEAIIYYQYDNGPALKEYMKRGEDGIYRASLEARGDKLRVWMVAGDDQTQRKTIEVVPRLAINRVDATITPPEYAKVDPVTMNLALAPAFMVKGSKVTLAIGFNKELSAKDPVQFVPVENDGKPQALPKIELDQASTPRQAIARWEARDSFRFRILATDKDGFKNYALEEYEIVVKPDQLPTVTIDAPRRQESRVPSGYLPMVIGADDDFGIASLKLIVDRIGTAPENASQPDAKKRWEIDLKDWQKLDSNGERQRYRLDWTWELGKTLGLIKPGDVLEYYVEVRDHYRMEVTDPRTGKSSIEVHPPQPSARQRLNIISEDQAKEAITNEIRSTADRTRAVQNTQRTTQNETRNLAENTKAREFDRGDREFMQGLGQRQSSLIAQTKTLENAVENIQKQLNENRIKDDELQNITRDAKDQLNQAADKAMSEASKQLNQAQQARTNSQNADQKQQAQDARNQAMQQAQQAQQQANQKLQNAIDQMDKVGTMQKAIKDFEQIRDQQEKLNKDLKEIGKQEMGKDPRDMKPENRQKLEQIAKDQKELANKTDKATESMQQMSKQMQRSDPNSSKAMEQAAQQAQQQQISQNQRSAGEQAQQNKQAGAQQSQQQAQLGIEVVLNTLKEAERRKLAQLIAALDDAIKNIQDLIRRQSGHNIDNLDIQGKDAWTKAMKPEEKETLFARALRDIKNPAPKPAAGVLTNGQEQTERNTRNVAKTIEDMPEGQAASSDLIRAAGKMGYAIVELRDAKMPDAYKPHQVDALAALEASLKKAEEQRERAAAAARAKDAEALKQKFERIRDEQVKTVNTPTLDIDKARDKAGALPRPSMVRLGQLPGAQGAVADEVKKLREELKKLGGVVYDWSAKEIGEAMADVKDELGKQKTGKPVQLQEARIVEQLDAMIESLKQEKNKSEFAAKNGGGGGGGGGGGSKLPTEVELRLLKALQLSINKNTQSADALPRDQRDKVAMVQLGTRQGQLRNLLDALIKQATQNPKEGLGPEPDPKDKLPEEAGKEDIDNQEIDNELLTGKEKAEKETKQLNRVGDRMARSRSRLVESDPGKVTQEIQKRIVVDLDSMIKQAQQTVASNPSSKPGQQQGQPKPGGQQPGQQQAGQPQQNNSNSPAQVSQVSPGSVGKADLSQNIKETLREWGNLSPRLRESVIEGSTENVVEKYRKLIEDYYRGVATGGKN